MSTIILNYRIIYKLFFKKFGINFLFSEIIS